MKSVTTDTVKSVSKMIRIFIPDSELDVYLDNLQTSLEPAKVFSELDTENIQGTSQTINTKNVLREDKSEESLTQDQALSNAKDSKNGYFVVKKVI